MKYLRISSRIIAFKYMIWFRL